MKVRKSARSEDTIELQMTPMIDIVFQLLVFFVMTFNVDKQEGGFLTKLMKQQPSDEQQDPPEVNAIELRMHADPNTGELKGIDYDQKALDMDNDPFQELHNRVRDFVSQFGDEGSFARSEIEMKLDPDYRLDFKYVIKAMEAVRGYRSNDADGRIVTLIEKISFKDKRTDPLAEGGGM